MHAATNDNKRKAKFVPLTAAQARNNLLEQGITITAFAKAHQLPRDVVADVLRGKLQGNYGSSHLAAVALGMKANPEIAAKSRARKRRG